MRNIRIRRRFNTILVLLLVLTGLIFFESRIEAFAPEFKALAEGRIEGIFSGKIGISIGTLEGGIIRPFALKDVSILNKSGKASNQIIEIKSMVSNYRIWDFIFSKLLSKAPCIAVDFSTKNDEVRGFVMLEGSMDNASLDGYIRLFEKERVEVRGSIKNGIIRLILKPKDGAIKVECNCAADGVLLVRAIISHLKIHDFDIAADVTAKNIIVKNTIDSREISCEGEIEAKNIVLNYKPFGDIKASYRASKGFLEISDLDMGGLCRINGKFGLKNPYLINATATTDNLNLAQALSVFNGRYPSFLSGTMNSKWIFKGPAGKLGSSIRMEIKKGCIGEMKFEYLNATLKGDGPIVRIEDSRIMRQSGCLILAGEMDIRRMGKDILFENLKIADGENAVLWDGWDTARRQDVSEFRMSKNLADGFNIGFKKFINEEKVDESIRDRDEFELSYNLHPAESLKLKFSDNKPFFGLEHKDEF